MPPITLSSPGAIFFKVGAVTVRWYGVMIALGFLAATWAASALAKRRDFNVDHLINGSLVAFMSGILGARLYFVALSWESFAQHPQDILATWLGGLSIHGGIIGGLIGGWLYCRLMKISFLTGIDIAAAVLPLAQAIGRWGNFFNSEAFGRPVDEDFPLRLLIAPEHRPGGLESYKYFHPTFLYESVWNLLIFFILYYVTFNRLKAYPGMNFLAYLLLYSVGRFLIEPLRTDSIMFGTLPAPSVVSGALIVLSAVAILIYFAIARSRPAAPQSENGHKAD